MLVTIMLRATKVFIEYLDVKHLANHFTYTFTLTFHKSHMRQVVLLSFTIIPIPQRQELRPGSHHQPVLYLIVTPRSCDSTPCTCHHDATSFQAREFGASFLKPLPTVLALDIICSGNLCVFQLPWCWQLKVRELFWASHVLLSSLLFFSLIFRF